MDFNYINTMQKKLSELIGVSGFEENVSTFIINEIENFVDKVEIDPLGNVLAIKNGSIGKNRIMFDAHTDEIGLMVSFIEKNGFLHFTNIGGWDIRTLLGNSVVIQADNGTIFHGVIGSKPPHLTTPEERTKVVPIKDMYIDCGFNTTEEVIASDIHVGSVGTVYDPFVEFPNGMVRGKAFDDRTACNVLINLLKLLDQNSDFEDTVVFSFSVQEEIGGRGAGAAAYTLKPTMAIAVENTTAADVPNIPPSQRVTEIGKGPAITVADRSLISSLKVNNRLFANAKNKQIPYQIKTPPYGGTDAGIIHKTIGGIPSSVVSVPCRYIHSSTSLLKLTDIYDTIRLLETFVRNEVK